MSKHRYIGGIISANQPAPTQASASGVWTLDEAEYYQKAGNWPAGGANDPYFPYTTLLLHGDGTNGAQNNTFLDSSTNNFTITRNGNTTQGSFDPYVGPGCWSNYFNGTTDYLSAASSSAFGFGTGDFTVEYWVYATSWSTTPTIVDLRAAAGNSGFSDFISTGGAPNMYWYNTTVLTSTLTIPLNTWTHVAYTRASGVIKIFVNGALGASGTSTSDLQASVPCKIGATFTPSNYFAGYLSNVRIVKGAALYTAAFTPSTTPLIATTQTTFLTCNSNGFNDLSAANNTITRNGSAQVSKFSLFTFYQTIPASYSGNFNGASTSYLSIGATPNLNLGTGDFTIEFWYFPVTIPSGNTTILSNGNATWSASAITIVGGTGGTSSTGLRLAAYDYNTTTSIVYDNTATTLNQWTHYAITRSGNLFSLYRNGVSVSTNTWNGTINLNNNNATKIGGGSWDNASVNGSISNLRITKGVAVYTANFTPSTAPLTTTTTVPANQNYSVSLDGNGDYLALPSGSGLTLGATDFTMEAWVYPTARVTNSAYIVGQSSYGVGTDFVWWITSTGLLQFYMLSGTIVTSTSTIPLNAWTHVAIVRSGALFRMYINGTLDGTLTGSQFITNSYLPTTIGNSTNNTGSVYFPGQISNLRITKGVAVYTTNFTPSTAALTSTTTVPSNQNWSTSFDGTGDYLSVASNAAFGVGTGDFTIEYWVYLNTLSGFPSGFDLRTSTGDTAPSDYFNSSGVPVFYYNSANLLVSSGSITASTWNHIAWVRSGTTITCYINGVAKGTATSSANFGTTQPLRIGANIALTGNTNGFISNFRFTKGQALYTTGFTPSTSPLTTTSQGATAANVSLLTCQNGILQDNSNNLFAVTPAGDAKAVSINPFVSTNGIGGTSYSGTFNGSTDCLSMTSSNFITSGDFTIECWAYVNAAQVGNYAGIFSTRDSANSAGISINLLNNGNIDFGCYPGGGYTGTAAPLNQWFHVAMVRSGTAANNIKCFVNGVLVGSYSSTATTSTLSGLALIGRYYVSGASQYFLNGSVSNLRYVVGSALYSANFTPSTAPLTAITNTQLLTCQSPTFVDNSANALAITVVGSASTNVANPFSGGTALLTGQNSLIQDNSGTRKTISVYGDAKPTTMNPFVSTNGIGGTSYSGAFAGTGYLTATSSTAFPIGTENFTVEMWLNKSNAWNTANQVLMISSTASSFQLWVDAATNSIKLSYNGGTTILTYSAASLQINQWYHLAVVRNGSAFAMYINGVSVATATDTGSFATPSSIIIANYTSGTANIWNGYISNLRVVRGQALYTAGFGPSTTPLTAVSGTSLLTCQSTTFVDNSSNALALTLNGTGSTDVFNPFSGATTLLTCQSTTFIDNSALPKTITANGSALPKRANPFTDSVSNPSAYTTTTYGGSAYFDGTGDYLTLGSQTNFAFGTGDFTIEAWIYPAAVSAGAQTIYDTMTQGDASGTGRIGFDFSTVLRFFTGAGTVLISGGTMVAKAWQHVALCKASGSTRLFLNGAQVGSTYADSNNYVIGTANRPIIGVNAYDASSNIFTGYISNLRVIKGLGLYTAPFVPPTAPVTAVTNTQLLVNATNAGIFDNTTVNDLETVGSAQVSTSVVKYGTGSMSFNGLNSYLTFPDNPANRIIGDFTIEAWIYRSANANQTILGLGQNNNGYAGVRLDIGSDSKFYVLMSTNGTTWAVNFGSTNTISLTTWTHVAVVRSGSTVTLYINGVSNGTATASGAMYASTIYTIGVSYQTGALAQYFNGYIDDVRVTQGYARYTANFTPPPGPFPNY